MSNYKSVVSQLVESDFGIEGHGRWLRSKVHSSLVIDDENGIFHFNSKGLRGDELDYLVKVRGMDFKSAKDYLKSFPKYKGIFVHTVEYNKGDIVVSPRLVDIFFYNGLKNRDYWYRRAFTDETINRFQLGYYEGWYTIPFFMGGTFRNFQMRRDDPKRTTNWYKNVGPLLFNSDILKLTNKIIITEGPTDCIILNQNGIPAISTNTGSGGWQDEWFSSFLYQKEVYVVFDNDDAGRFGAKRIAEKLGKYKCKIYTFDGMDEKFDVGEFFTSSGTKDEFLDLIYSKSKHVFEINKNEKK